MSNTTDDNASQSSGPMPDEEAQRILAEIKQFRAQAEDEFKAAETARKKADSEGLFAFNAKKTCEEHATVISQMKGVVETDAAAVQSHKQKSDEYLAAVTSLKATLEADGKIIAERRKESEASAQSISAINEACAQRNGEVEKARTEVDEAMKSAFKSRDAATDAQKGAETSQKNAESINEDAQDILKQITANHESSNQRAGEIDKALSQAKEHEENLKSIVEHLAKSDEISTGYEDRLKKLTEDTADLLKRVDSLLPGAASASLASSFNAQKLRFAGPQKRWLWTFVGCIIGLVFVALPSFLAALGIAFPGHSADMPTSDLWRSLLLRMPIVIPLVWLAIYAGRNYMLSLRMEEEYGYKEAVSTAFEGYKREMTNIPVADPANPTPLVKLCTNILAAIAERPGRIYEGKHRDITILNETRGVAEDLTELAKKQIAAR
jgi:chemotaxis protein histidine kinase CheA